MTSWRPSGYVQWRAGSLTDGDGGQPWEVRPVGARCCHGHSHETTSYSRAQEDYSARGGKLRQHLTTRRFDGSPRRGTGLPAAENGTPLSSS
eukprot:scaffold22347_cov71-Phaeocystis_antarctica.AAC.3